MKSVFHDEEQYEVGLFHHEVCLRGRCTYWVWSDGDDREVRGSIPV